jgi:hypothetical protein
MCWRSSKANANLQTNYTMNCRKASVAGVARASSGALRVRAADRAAEAGNGHSRLHPHQTVKQAEVARVVDRSLIEGKP